MRKITALLCAAAVATSAFAAQNNTWKLPTGVSLDGFELAPSERVSEMALKSEALAKVASGDAVTRAFNDPTTGQTWEFSLTRSTIYTWGDFYVRTDQNTGEKHPVTMEEWPFHIGMLEVFVDENTHFWYVVSWPSNLYFVQMMGMTNDGFVPDDPSTYDYTPADPTLLLNDADDGLIHTFKSVDNRVVGYLPYSWSDDDPTYEPIYWSMVGINQLFTNTCKIAGRDVDMRVPIDETEQARLEFESFDPSTLHLKAYMRFFYEDLVTHMVNSRSFSWDAPVRKVAGFVNFNFDFPKLWEVHVFKDRLYSGEELMTELQYLGTDMQDVYRYYIAAFSEGVSLGIQSAFSNDPSFGTDHYGYVYATDNRDQSIVNFMMGSMFSPADMTEFEPKGIWEMEEIVEVDDPDFGKMIVTYPKPYSLISSAYSGAFNPSRTGADGFFGVNKAYSVYFDAPTRIQFGSTDGLVITATDNVGDVWTVRYDGPIIYHYDNNDITLTREIASVGTDTPIESIQPAKVENLLSETEQLKVALNGRNILAPAGSAVYDMNGRRVSPRGVEPGIYLVRCGKSTTKILVR